MEIPDKKTVNKNQRISFSKVSSAEEE